MRPTSCWSIWHRIPLGLEQAGLRFATRVAAETAGPGRLGWRLLGLRMHRLSAGDALAGRPAGSRLMPDRAVLARLHAAGRAEADRWLARIEFRQAFPA